MKTKKNCKCKQEEREKEMQKRNKHYIHNEQIREEKKSE